MASMMPWTPYMHADMSMITDMIARVWETFLARPTGGLNLRFILQPTIATIIAVRAGMKDAREGRPAYLWTAFTNSEHRWQLLHGGWKDLCTVETDLKLEVSGWERGCLCWHAMVILERVTPF